MATAQMQGCRQQILLSWAKIFSGEGSVKRCCLQGHRQLECKWGGANLWVDVL